MKIWHTKTKTAISSAPKSKGRTSNDTSIRSFALKTLAITLALGGSIVFLHFNDVKAADQAVDFYCKKYTVTAQNTACKDGWNGHDCNDYDQIDPGSKKICQDAATASNCKDGQTPSDASTQKICSDASKAHSDADKAASGSGTDNGSGSNNGSNSNGSSSNGNGNNNNSNNKTPTKVNPDLIPDNNYGAYVNGAGKLQPIQVNRAPGDSRPAIVFFNGGGWHTDDGVGQKIAPAANARGYTTFVASYRLGSSGIYYMLDDVQRAMRHIRNNAGMYGIDPSRIAIWGDSAGGSLAVRAAATGLSGAKVAVGWSAPTNAYTALFKSARTFAIGMDHSTCIPTDLNGASDVIDQLNGGNGTNPQTGYGGGLADNGTSSGSGALGVITDVLQVAKQAQDTSQSAETISKQLGTEEGQKQLGENARRLAAKKFLECIDNFNSASPALFASALSPPTFLAGFDSDPLVDPGQAYQMRDKLRSLGIASEALILPGVKTDAAGSAVGTETPGENHLDYNEKFVGPSLDFVDKFLHP
jgi:acetyl esterase/lipase